MAARYLYHLVSNHPFVDGNKRTGLAAALVFLDLNRLGISSGTDRLYELTMKVAEGESTPEEVSSVLSALANHE